MATVGWLVWMCLIPVGPVLWTLSPRRRTNRSRSTISDLRSGLEVVLAPLAWTQRFTLEPDLVAMRTHLPEARVQVATELHCPWPSLEDLRPGCLVQVGSARRHMQRQTGPRRPRPEGLSSHPDHTAQEISLMDGATQE